MTRGNQKPFAVRTTLFVCLSVATTCAATTPASALSLNAFRTEHHLPALSLSATLAGMA